MSDRGCVELLQWALPRLGKRWKGFRNVRGQVCKRLVRRARELGLADLDAYRAHLEAHDDEWAILDALCRVTISRFYRDRGVYDRLRRELLPDLADRAAARGETVLRAWSAGCASGEEPYTLAMIWTLELATRFPGMALAILATDLDEEVLQRAELARYETGSLRELPAGWRDAAFREDAGLWRVREEIQRLVELRRGDVRRMPDEMFDLILCRNLAFTYLEEAAQREVGRAMAGRLVPGGVLIVGGHEALPDGVDELVPLCAGFPGYRPAP